MKSWPRERDDAGHDVDNAFQCQRSPAIVVTGRMDRGDNREYAVHQHIGGEHQDERQHRGARQREGDDAERDAQKSPQCQRPPILSKNGRQRGRFALEHGGGSIPGGEVAHHIFLPADDGGRVARS